MDPFTTVTANVTIITITHTKVPSLGLGSHGAVAPGRGGGGRSRVSSSEPAVPELPVGTGAVSGLLPVSTAGGEQA